MGALLLPAATAALSPSLLPPLAALQALTAEFRPDGPLPIAIASFQCAVPKPDFTQQVIDAAERGSSLIPRQPISLR